MLPIHQHITKQVKITTVQFKTTTSELNTLQKIPWNVSITILWSPFFLSCCLWQGKINPRTSHEGPEGEKRHSSTFSLTLALDKGGWSTGRQAKPFYPRERYPVLIVEEAGWAPVPVWLCAEKLAPGIRSPDCPACIESLYRLRYPGAL